MSLAQALVRRHVAVALLSTLIVACNAVVGIEEPIDMSVPDSGFAADAPPVSTDGPASTRDRASDGGGAAIDTATLGDGTSIMDVATGVDVTGGGDVIAGRDIAPVGDVAVQDRPGGPITDSGSGIAPPDGREGGVVVSPGLATGSCTFSGIVEANADTSPYSSTSGIAQRKLAGIDENIDLNLTNFIRGVQRVLNVRLRGPVTAGKTIVLDELNFIEYYDVKTGRGWGSAFASPRAGTLKIEDVNGASFSFTITKVKMGAHTSMVGSVGSFTLDGYGSANPQ